MQIDKICRACLREDDKIIKPEKDIYQKFLLFTNLTAEEEIPNIPLNLCRSCEQKLNISLDFKEECQKSHEILLNYVKNTFPVKSEVNLEATDVHIHEVDLEASDVKNTCEVKLEATYADTFELVYPEATDVKNSCEVKLEAAVSDTLEVDSEAAAAAVSNAKKSSRIDQFSQSQVLEAIKDLKQHSYKNLNCIRCSYIGNHLPGLSVHVSRVHKDLKSHWCCPCNAEFDNLTDHISTYHSDDYTCKFCSKKFQSISNVTEHLRNHSDVKPFPCSFCEKCFIKQSYLNVHLNDHTKEKLYKCGLCDASFTQLYRLQNHSKKHESEGDADKQPFIAGQNFCVKCNKKVRSLLAHTKQVHTMSDNDHSCMVCGKQFKTAIKLKLHMGWHTREAPHKCKYCDKKFKIYNDLVQHELTHTGERPHICQVCGRSFARTSALKTHMLLHNIGSKRSCNICNKQFCRLDQLRLHLRRHTGEKPYVCAECGKGFITRNHLNDHNKIHSGLRPYQCSYCDKSFGRNTTLRQHMLVHSDEKPYKCNQCSYSCRQSCSLTQHMMQHEVDKPQADRPHVCLICNRTFTTNAMLTSHINTHNVSFLQI